MTDVDSLCMRSRKTERKDERVARERAVGDEREKEVRERELSSIIDTQIIKNWTITKVYFVDKK